MYSVEEVTRNVPFGYLSVLLGFVCLNCRAKTQVEAQLAGHTIEPLLSFIRKFTTHYQAIDRACKDDRLVEGQPDFAKRIEVLLQQLTR